MKTSCTRKRNRAFAFVDLIIVIGTIVMLGMILPALSKAKCTNCRIKCSSNLKQVGLAFRGFAQDWDDRYPFQARGLTNYVGTVEGGTLVAGNTTPADAWMHFQVLSNELSTAKVLICPMDRSRINGMAEDFSTNTIPRGFASVGARNASLSYFYGVAAEDTKPQLFLTGDRNLAPAQSKPSYSSVTTGGLVYVPTAASWSQAAGDLIHTNQGNIALADGSVQQVDIKKL